jgi:hypothetical protein
MTTPKSGPSIDQRIRAVRAQIVGMQNKVQRLTDAIRQRQQSLARLEASAVLSNATPPARTRHE